MNKKDITIIIPTSYIPSHPSTKIIETTIKNTRFHFPDSEIILQIDGLRIEQAEYKKDYDEHKNRVLWKCLHEWQNVLPIIFDQHSHQSTMMKKTINLVQTPLILYIEGDLPLRIDRDIDWNKCLDMFEYNKANTIRFYLREEMPQEHIHMMCGQEDIFMKTVQWSQNPHLSFTKYYKNIILPNIGDKNYIEDEFYGKAQVDCEYLPGEQPVTVEPYVFKIRNWEAHKMFIYYPDNGQNVSRVLHLDGRQSTRKFTQDDEFWSYTSIKDAKKILSESELFKNDEDVLRSIQ
jgi:hypothetical protein